MARPIEGESLTRSEAGTLAGTIAVARLPRLAEQLRELDGKVAFQIESASRADGNPAVNVKVSGALKLSCQRCLGLLECPLESARQIVFAPVAALPEIEDEEEFADFVPIDTRFVLRDLIEDEVLLSLPMVPAHESGACAAASKESAEARVSPFAALAKATKQ